jgi:outer membrane lipoprotein SlyB
MKNTNRSIRIALLGLGLAAVGLAACNSAAEPTTPIQVTTITTPAPKAAKCYDCGTISGIEQMKVKGEGTGLGAVIGVVVGAAIGHQIGGGRGNDAATATGAIAGGIAGHQIERRVKGSTYFHVTVAMETGGLRTVDVESMNGLGNGSRVRIIGNDLQMAS